MSTQITQSADTGVPTGGRRRRVLTVLLFPLLLLLGVGTAAAVNTPATNQSGAKAAPTSTCPLGYCGPTITTPPEPKPTTHKPEPTATQTPTATKTPTQTRQSPRPKPKPSTSSSPSPSSSSPSSSSSSSSPEAAPADDDANKDGGLTTTGTKGSVWLQWMSSKDSYGNAPWAYDLRVSTGGITDPIKKMGAFLLSQFWEVYRLVASIMVWSFQFILEFKFVDIVRVPADTLSRVIEDVTTQLGVVPMLATLSAVVSGFWILKGRSGAGFGEMAVTAVIVTIIGMGVMKPSTMITGEDGLMTMAKDGGASVTANLLYPKAEHQAPKPTDPNDPNSPEHGGSTPDPEVSNPKRAAQNAISRRMLDTFIRTPHQLLNYGLFIDEEKDPDPAEAMTSTTAADTSDTNRKHKSCFNAYNDAYVVRDDGKPRAEAKTTMGAGSTCPKVVKDTMEHPDRSLVGAYLVAWALLWTTLFGIILLLGTSFLIGLAAWEAAKFLLALVKSILPGASREGMFTSGAIMLVTAAFAAAAIVLVGVYLLTLTAIFNATSGWNPVLVYLFIDIAAIGFCIGACIMFFRVRKHGKKAGRAAADKITPKGGPKPMPTGRGLGQTALNGASRLAQTRAITRSNTKALSGGAGAGGGPGQAGSKPLNPAPRKSAATTALKGAGKAAKLGLAYTVGAPVAAPKAAAAAKTALKAGKSSATKSVTNSFKNARAGLRDKQEGASAYMTEWKNNVADGGRFIGRASRTVTPAGRENWRNHRHQVQESSRPKDTEQLYNLRTRMGEKVSHADRIRAGIADANYVSPRQARRPYTQRQQQRHGSHRAGAMDARTAAMQTKLAMLRNDRKG